MHIAIVFEILKLIGPVIHDVIQATKKDSPGGKRITKKERKAIADAVTERLLSKEAGDILDDIKV